MFAVLFAVPADAYQCGPLVCVSAEKTNGPAWGRCIQIPPSRLKRRAERVAVFREQVCRGPSLAS